MYFEKGNQTSVGNLIIKNWLLTVFFSFTVRTYFIPVNILYYLITPTTFSNPELGDRQILEKPILEIIKNAQVSVIVEKNKKLANLLNSQNLTKSLFYSVNVNLT